MKKKLVHDWPQVLDDQTKFVSEITALSDNLKNAATKNKICQIKLENEHRKSMVSMVGMRTKDMCRTSTNLKVIFDTEE